MNILATHVAAIATAATLLTGCAPLNPRFDQGFGEAVRLAVQSQIKDKDAAAKNAGRDASGLDGVAAKEVMDRYQKSFRAPVPSSSVFTIGVSDGSSSR